MKIYATGTILMLIFCSACQSPSGSHQNDSSKSGIKTDTPAQTHSGNDSSRATKKDLAFSKQLQLGRVSFHLYSPNNKLHNSIIIQPSGLKDSSFIQTGIIGNVEDAFIGDLNKDGFP